MIMNRLGVVLFVLLLAVVIVNVGCAGYVTKAASESPAAPSITTQPASQTVTTGQTATFSVVAAGTAPLSYQWMKGGTTILGATSSSYTTPPTTSSDNGSQFSVMVSNSTGNVTSNAATLTVNAAAVAPSITTQPASQTVTAGQTATFTVVATGTAPLSYQWMKGGTTISGATSSSYTTPATTSADNGSQFSNMVSNIAGSATSNAATLTVNPTQPVQITTTSLPSGQVQTSYSASLQATGGTPPYTWSVIAGQLPNGLTLSSSSGLISGTPTLAGTSTFTVQANDNAGGSASAALGINIGTTVMPTFGHVAVVVLENTNYTDMVGSSSMPYFNSLINQFGLATQYYANTHPSIGNYLMMTTGQILTNDDSRTPLNFPVSGDNVVRELLAAGKTWKAYAEDLPSVGYTGGNTGLYAVRHNPLAYMTDVQNSTAQKQNLVPFTQFASDLAGGNLPNYSFIVPNLCNDGHDCPLTTVDPWLQANIDPLIKNPVFQKDGLLIVVCDESQNYNTHGGGRIPAVLISPAFSRVAYQSTTRYQHQSLLRLTLEGLGRAKSHAKTPPMCPTVAYCRHQETLDGYFRGPIGKVFFWSIN